MGCFAVDGSGERFGMRSVLECSSEVAPCRARAFKQAEADLGRDMCNCGFFFFCFGLLGEGFMCDVVAVLEVPF